jgi:hypothetical protein
MHAPRSGKTLAQTAARAKASTIATNVVAGTITSFRVEID